ncbi:MAG TPA: L-threonylcarbamoyladenylate synthase [Fimbriimonadaceae bacterium]|nr:L-threonylcarbamoyladenylate synthase [Fimbriimonadaceae bacterium]
MRIEQATPDVVKEAAKAIKKGEMVVLPTETVYGLACNALDAAAVNKVFEAKGRPSENPLIVHIADFQSLRSVAASWPDLAESLAERFWPGPLTMVLKKKASVPDETTAGLDTVAVRVPDHPVALAVIREAGVPIAAPSANVFTRLSPTRAEDVDPKIADMAAMVLDGGRCRVGLESTVIDMTAEHPRILRPGGVTRAQVQAVVGRPLGHLPPPSLRKSPGTYARHYAPHAVLTVVDKIENGQPGLTFKEPKAEGQIKMPDDPAAYAARLYHALRELDESGHDRIFVERPPSHPDWEAVHDRLKKASAN